MGKNDRIVSRRPNGDWANKEVGNDRASSLHATQKAEKAAKDMQRRFGRWGAYDQGREWEDPLEGHHSTRQ